jgi:hypothetical protein
MNEIHRSQYRTASIWLLYRRFGGTLSPSGYGSWTRRQYNMEAGGAKFLRNSGNFLQSRQITVLRIMCSEYELFWNPEASARSVVPKLHSAKLWHSHWLLLFISCRWGETISLNCGHQLAYCSSPRWYRSMERDDGMILTGKNWRTRETPAPVPLRPPQIPHGPTRAQTRASAVRGRRLTAWAMARLPIGYIALTSPSSFSRSVPSS